MIGRKQENKMNCRFFPFVEKPLNPRKKLLANEWPDDRFIILSKTINCRNSFTYPINFSLIFFILFCNIFIFNNFYVIKRKDLYRISTYVSSLRHNAECHGRFESRHTTIDNNNIDYYWHSKCRFNAVVFRTRSRADVFLFSPRIIYLN